MHQIATQGLGSVQELSPEHPLEQHHIQLARYTKPNQQKEAAAEDKDNHQTMLYEP